MSQSVGQLGVLAYDVVEDKIQCHLCGKWFRGLNTHVRVSHGWTLEDYREEFGLNKGQSLICEGTRQKLGAINKKLKHWKHLISQRMTKDELREFLAGVRQKKGYKLRAQTCLLKSEMLQKHNPMNEPEAQQRRIAKQKKTWYGTPRMRALSSKNLKETIAKLRERNLTIRKWLCPCGQAFATREEARSHWRYCPYSTKSGRKSGESLSPS